MSTNINEYIQKKKRKKTRKKIILVSIILIVILGLILIKTPYFNIKKVNVNNNNIQSVYKISFHNVIAYIKLSGMKHIIIVKIN